jgi:hypothetical protein
MIKNNEPQGNGFHKFAIAVLLAPVFVACNLISTLAPTPTVQAIVDSFFSGYAYLDVNSNGEIDPEDTPVENAMFIVTIPGGFEVGAATDESGYAFIVAPGGVDYPVTMRMEAPKDSSLKLVGPSEITVTSPGQSPEFLFSSE